MSQAPTLYRFRIDLADVDRGLYELLDFRVAMHPSESPAYLLTRVLAFVLNHQEGLKFSAEGLGSPELPAITLTDVYGKILLWIEIGNPTAKKLHKASKAAAAVKIYTYKNPQLLMREVDGGDIHQAEKIEVIPFTAPFLESLAQELTRDVRWQVLFHDGVLAVNTGNKSEQIELHPLHLKP